MEPEETLKDVAFKYFLQGHRIVPFLGKAPLVNWGKWQTEPQTREEFDGLPWGKADGFAIVCGIKLNNDFYVGVLDLDVEKANVPLSEETLQKQKKVIDSLLVTQREKTPSGGKHHVYYSKAPVKTRTVDDCAIEVLGEGKLCIMAPSKGYMRANDNPPSDVDDLNQEFMEALKKAGIKTPTLPKTQQPESALPKTQQPESALPKTQQPERVKHVSKSTKVRPCFLKLMEKETLSHGERVALVIELEWAGYSESEIKTLFHEHQAWHPAGYSQETTDKQIESILGRYRQEKKETLKEKGTCFQDCSLQGYTDCRRTSHVEQYLDENKKFIPKLLAEELMQEYYFITMCDTKQIYVFKDGYYHPHGETIIQKECRARLDAEYRTHRFNEVVDFIRASTYVTYREEPANLVPLKNGVLDLETLELKPHSPEYMFFNLLPLEYNPSADCPNIKKFLGEIAAEGDATILLEILGYCLYRNYPIAKALMLVGEGSNGKSTFLSLVKTFLGAENVSGRCLQELEVNRFAKADLHNKLANIYSDLPDKSLHRTGIFKMLTGGDLITAEKKFLSSFNFVNYAKLLFSCNKVPEVYDDTDAFFRRWIIIVFPNKFVGEKSDPNMLSKLTTPNELSGLLNLALDALKKLLERGTFTYSKTTEELREDYTRKSSPIAAFTMDCLESDSDAIIEKKALYSVFAAYCRSRNLPAVSEHTFFRNLPQHIAINDYKPTIAGKRIYTFKGIKYTEAVATLTGVERQFIVSSSRSEEFRKEPWDTEDIPGEYNYIKITIPDDNVSVKPPTEKQEKLIPDDTAKTPTEKQKKLELLWETLMKNDNNLTPH
ncbi:MAG: phage/plasmid primase, P4 family [Candidatus Bathyarchaeia archaeon]|jgi:P4 family phage/plasmid primase-like protien